MGSGDGRLRMDFVPETADVAAGDLVVTSGIDGIFPKGFPIGQVVSVEKSGTLYKESGIIIRPAVDFASLEQVLVVLTPTPVHETPNADPPVPNPGDAAAAPGRKP